MTPRLTPREAEIARLLEAGLSPKEAALHLGIGLGTVRARIKHAAARVPGPHAPLIRLILWARETPQKLA